MSDFDSEITKAVVGFVGVLACLSFIYILCHYFPLTEPRNDDLPVKSPIPVTTTSSPAKKISSPATKVSSPAMNNWRMTFIPADSPTMVKSPAMNISSPRLEEYAADEESCSEDYAADEESGSPDALLLEKVGPEVYVSLKTYEKALKHLDEANLKVQYWFREGWCTDEHLKLYQEKLNDTTITNTKLKDVILRGLQEKYEFFQVNLEFDRINFKFRHLVGDYYEK